jgi:ABC-2 type transport system ATP-binding protein
MRSDGTRRRRDGNHTDSKRNFVGWFSIARLSRSQARTPAALNTPILEVRDLVKVYPAATAVAGVSFSVPAGICFGLLGPNGAGKTTTIEIMEGILPPTSGVVRYRGEPLGARFHQEAGILFQKTALQDFLTVRQCISLFRGLYDRGLEVDEVIRLCALEKLATRDNRKLSGGQQQRLLLAIALVNDPAVLFLDEPTTGLDPQARRAFWELVQSIKAQRKTIILTTHYMEEAELLCDEIVILDHGRVVAQGPPRQLLREHFAQVLLDLPRQDFPAAARTLPLNILDSSDRVEITTDDLEGTLRTLLAASVPLTHLRIRPANLEDLFLKLTGTELRP